MRLVRATEIEPTLSRCIEVDSPEKLFAAGGKNGMAVVSHNSVVQRNIILGCILRPESWKFIGIDLKRVELSVFRKYANVVLAVATTVPHALTALKFAQETMYKRYTMMEQLQKNNFLDLPERGQALLIMVDEAGELLTPSGVKALSENTPIPTPEGLKKLSELEIGDKVLDIYGSPTTILNKYEPEEQTRFNMIISNDTEKVSETIVSGSEHNWVAYFKYPDGEIEGPEIVTTEYLYEFKKAQENLPETERTSVKFKRCF